MKGRKSKFIYSYGSEIGFFIEDEDMFIRKWLI